jgi:hypothetical protein
MSPLCSIIGIYGAGGHDQWSAVKPRAVSQDRREANVTRGQPRTPPARWDGIQPFRLADMSIAARRAGERLFSLISSTLLAPGCLKNA